MHPASSIQDPGSWIQAPGSWILQKPRLWTHAHHPKVLRADGVDVSLHDPQGLVENQTWITAHLSTDQDKEIGTKQIIVNLDTALFANRCVSNPPRQALLPSHLAARQMGIRRRLCLPRLNLPTKDRRNYLNCGRCIVRRKVFKNHVIQGMFMQSRYKDFLKQYQS